jgi:multicomponent Na+:H+ antiporter subunit F
MTSLLLALAVVLLASLLAGLVRVAIGPTAADRMLAVQLMGSTSVCVLLLVARAWDRPELVDVSLVFGLLAAVAAVAFTRYGGEIGERKEEAR